MFRFLLFGALVTIPLAIILYQLSLSKYDEFVCSSVDLMSPNPQGECFVPENYQQSKEQFISLAGKCNAELYSLPILENNPNLTIDIAILRGSKDNFLLHLSGTHGVEAYSGASIQAAYLHSLCHSKSTNPYPSETEPTLIFVHSVNPFGFNFNRRFNEDNIDLNRNFLTPNQFETFLKRDPNHSGYESLTDVFNPSYPPLSVPLLQDLNGLWNAVRILIRVGFGTVKGALVAGTYHSPRGLYYGGRSYSNSARLLRDFFTRPDIGLINAKKYVFVDVHTGLGPSGVDTLMIHDEEPGCKLRTEKYFPTEHSSSEPGQQIGGIKPWLSHDAGDVEKGYEMTAGFTSNFFCDQLIPNFNPTSRICFTQEFGTYSPLLVAKGLVDENQAYHFGTEEQKKFYGERLRSLFFVHTKDWVRSVVRRGTLVISQSIAYLKEE